MIIRNYQDNDLEQLKVIHERYYKDEFSISEFYQKFIGCFVVIENDKMICAGGVRPIAESVIVTDKSFSARQRRDALLQMLQAHTFVSNRNDFKQLHAFIQDPLWKAQLLDYGFKECKGNALVIEV